MFSSVLVGAPDVKKAYSEAILEQSLSRGDLNPLGIDSFDMNYMKAPLTHTNSVPQFKGSNSGPWSLFESRIASYATGTLWPKRRDLVLIDKQI